MVLDCRFPRVSSGVNSNAGYRAMEKTPAGTPVGVTDPYEHVERCDHLTDDGRCRLAISRPNADLTFARERAETEYACPVVDPDGDWAWADCPHCRSRGTDRECARCGLEERLDNVGDDRPLLEEHHLSYADSGECIGHEITVFLCRWCHAKVHNSWARLDDDVSPDQDALAQLEARRSRELEELSFETAADRFDR